MKLSEKTKQIIAISCLFFLICINLYLYRSEFNVVSDPNDNIFQYGLVDEAKNIWKQVLTGKLSPFYLIDSWNERWAEGYALSANYTHIPQIILSGTSILTGIDTYRLFVFIRTIFLILLPLSFYAAVRILGSGAFEAVAAAFFSQVIITDGLYGIDASSFLWRGWGLSAELFALFFLPVALAAGIRFITDGRFAKRALILNILVGFMHIGMFYLLLIAYSLIFVLNIFGRTWNEQKKSLRRVLSLIVFPGFVLAYFILPFILSSQYRNFSFWDPLWKFRSWGMMQVITWLLNGSLFDFNRVSILTFLSVFGVILGLGNKNIVIKSTSVLYILFFLLFFGSSTWGVLYGFLPGMAEYHQHRIIVMVQVTGIFAAAFITSRLFQIVMAKKYRFLIATIVIIPSFVLMEQPVFQYAKQNEMLLRNSSARYKQDYPDLKRIENILSKLPSGRVYAGRPGNWGRDFKAGDTQVYMVLSRDGFPVVGFLPQSWSPNSDLEQFFNEESEDHFRLYNVRYLIYPAAKKPPAFTEKIVSSGNYFLYKTTGAYGWFDVVHSTQTVKVSRKTELLNIQHNWILSKWVKGRDFPKIVFKSPSDRTYIFSNVTRSENLGNTEIKQETVQAQRYQATIVVKRSCLDCIVFLKQTYNPGWKMTINGRKINSYPVFPFYIGVAVPQEAGNYNLDAIYESDRLKTFIVFIEALSIFLLVVKNKDFHKR